MSIICLHISGGWYVQCDIRCGFFSKWIGFVKWISNQFCKSYKFMHATVFSSQSMWHLWTKW